ncbi:MAG: UvrD-helicase domain-containing protein [Mariprofundaceae bacterium]
MSAEVRSQAIDPSGSYLVLAPAGSGKTELLTQRILALLAVVDEPEEILALTFTRKAAAEMGNRVTEALVMKKPESEDSHKMVTWKLAHQALARSAERDWNLADHPARLRIMTLDSLTGTLARQLPLLSGLGEMPTPSEHTKTACREASEKALNEAMKRDTDAVETLLLHQDHNTVAVIDLMANMLENREQWLKYIVTHGRNTDALKKIVQSNLAELMNYQLQQCDALMPLKVKAALPALLRFAGTQLSDEALTAISTWPVADIDHLANWKTLANFLLTSKDPQFRKSVTKNHGFPPTAKDEKQQIVELLSLLADVPGLAEATDRLRALPDTPEFEQNQWQLAEALFELLPEAAIYLQSIFSSQGKADFTEIALRALTALNDAEGNPSDLLLKMDYRIQHILIDEFQDTSEMQMNLLRCLTSGWQADDGRTLFMVGDPMQSIYRFRKAEVGLFLQAANNTADLPPVTELQLEQNFRSSPVIVYWVNQAFSSIFPKNQDAVSGAITHAPAQAALSHLGSVQLHLLEASDDSKYDDQTEAHAVAMIVKQAVSRGLRVGILSRTRKHLHAIMPALSDADIPFRAIKILPLNTRPEIRTLRALTRALLHPADKESWLALLRSTCCGLTTKNLFDLLHNDERNVWEIMQDEQIHAKLEHDTKARICYLFRALEPCIAISGRIKVRDLVQTAWRRLRMASLLDETAQTNAEMLFELISSLDEKGRVDFSLLDERIESLFAAPNASKEAASVELMTMHGAKGLQWDAVILPGLGKPPRSSHQPLLTFTDVPMHGDALFLMSPKAETRSKDQLFSLVQSIESQKEANELARLLYVGCTRAKTELYMFGNLSKKSGDPKKGSLLELLQPSSQKDDSCFGGEVIHIETGDAVKASQRKTLQRMKSMPAPLPELDSEVNSEPEYGWAGPEAAPIGNTLHAILQQIAELGIESWNQQHSDQADSTMKRMLIGEGLSGKLLESAHSRCKKGLSKTLHSKLGKWILSGNHEDAHCEWALTSIHRGQLANQVIDRSFIDEEGIRWIIDYKTGSHEGSNLNAFLDSEQQRHSRQLEGYRDLLTKMDADRPIKTALYFPVFDGWREL